MTPAEHYAEAERLLDRATNIPHGHLVSVERTLARAQVHATLALFRPEPPPQVVMPEPITAFDPRQAEW